MLIGLKKSKSSKYPRVTKTIVNFKDIVIKGCYSAFYTHLISSSENNYIESNRACHNNIMQHSRPIFS